jgi:hypothetical protein
LELLIMRAPAARILIWRLGRLILALLLICPVQTQIPAQAQDDSAALALAVKAAYLYKLAPFVGWPAGALPPAPAPFMICIVGDDPFGALLDRVVEGQRLGDRPIAVRRMDFAHADDACPIMFLAGSNRQSVSDALESLRGRPVLTITDSAGRFAAKGIVHFVIVSERVRFEIDDAEAERCGLRISSKLLGLASSVVSRP